MKQTERLLFEALRDEVVKQFNANTGLNSSVGSWTTYDIEKFRDDLEENVRSKVSEKWVYSHFKNNNPSLPRIDVLNLLSEYTGYASWQGFVAAHRPRVKRRKRWVYVLPASIVILILIVGIVRIPGKDAAFLMITDGYTHEPVAFSVSDLTLTGGKADSLTPYLCKITYTDSVKAQFKSSYYKEASVTLTGETNDTINMKAFPDDIAFMLNYFTNSEPERWIRKAAQLDTLIHDEARIYHYHPDYNGIELLNKQEFINRITVPTKTLKEMKILDIRYRAGRVHRLRFITNE